MNASEIGAAGFALIFWRRENVLFSSEHFVAYRSPSPRLGWLPLAAASCAALGSAFFVGCQSGAQYDQVARELRMQEDELYALEDYLDQYQKLVCKYRSENAALRRQLSENGVTPSTSRPSKMSPSTPTGPRIDVPPSDRSTPPSDRSTPPSDIDSPDIPALEETTTNTSASRTRGRKSRRVKLTGGQIADGKVTHAQAIALEPVENTPPVSDVWLHGEVITNKTGGGPRMLVKVEPLDADGQPMAFNGPLSLMLMGPDEGGVQVPVARWDYKPQDVRAAITEGGKTIQFHLELPLDTPTTEEARLWVRLLQRRGAKVLAHAELQLHEPGLFSSRPETAGDKAGPMVATTSDDSEFDKQGDTPATTSVTSGASGMFDGGWAIARPGQPAGFAQDGPAESGDWRATLELPPSATASSAPAKPKPRVNRPREKTEIRNAASTNIAKRSTWSPERPEGASADDPRTATRPKWSATR